MRSAINAKDKWDLSPLFENDEEWNKLYNELEHLIDEYKKFMGTLSNSFETFKDLLEFDSSISRKIEKLFTYAHLKSDEDKTNQNYLAMHQRAMNLYTRISEAASFIVPEIQTLSEDTVKSYMAFESVKDFRFYIDNIIRFKPYTLSQEIEQILAMSGEVAHAPSAVFGQLDNADLSFGTIVNDLGNETELSHANFNTFLQSQNRDVRKNAFFTYYKAYYNHKNTIASTLSHSIIKDHFYSKVRGFKSCRESALFGENISLSVYDSLINTVKSNIKPLVEYLEFRKNALGISELHFYDTYVSMVDDVDFYMEFDEAIDTCIAALKPLGGEYAKILKEGLNGGWVDKYENKGKRSGAYSSGCYDSPPYILINYEANNINSLYTLIHEAGHSMHSYYSKTHQPYIIHDYTIFVAEVASTFNENLLSNYLMKKYADNPKMLAYVINREIDNIRATLYRQTMFAEFEKITHEKIEKNEPLTLEVFTNVYENLLNEYFGGALAIDNELKLECLRIPHFYSPFYVYKYATGISAAIALAHRVITEQENATEKYLDFLKLGGSMFPIDELVLAGVDMRDKEPVENTISHFSELIHKFMDIYKQLT
jgi:oligoendopeptidase F